MSSSRKPERHRELREAVRLSLVAAAFVAVAACTGQATSGTRAPYTPAPPEPGDPVAGAKVYSGSCQGCHGSDLKGVEGLGQQLAPSAFVVDQTEDSLVEFLIEGLPADDPDNRTGVEMPPKGGSPWLTPQDLHDVAAYVIAQQ